MRQFCVYIILIFLGVSTVQAQEEELTHQDSIQLGLIKKEGVLEFDERSMQLVEMGEEIDQLNATIKELESKSSENGSALWVTSIAAILLLGGCVFLIIRYRKFVKEVRSLEGTVEKAKRSLAEREKFLAYTNHEIRTPLNAVSGSAKLLENTQLSPKQEKYVHTIKASVDNVLILVNDVLDLSRLESGKIQFQSNDFLLWEVMQGIKYILQEKVDSKGIIFELELDDTIPAVIKGDPGHLNQILLNLANNAVKFTDLGSVVLKATKIADTENEIKVRFDIVDTGKGIRKSKLPTIFNQFEQETRHTIKHKGGSGLGLSITKQLVELQGGKIDVDSKYMEGTTFSVTLDFKKSKKRSLEKKTKESFDATILDNLRVLVVDDNEMNREIMKDLLQDCNPKVVTELVESGEKAVDYIQDNDIDIILMDIQMPNMDGFETTEYIRKNTRSPLNEVPIIAMTAYALEDAAQKCFEAGMNDYITKPVDPNFLVTKVERLLKRSGTGKGKNLSLLHVDLAKLKEFTGGDNTKMFKYIDIFLKNVPSDIQSLEKAVDQRDWKRVLELAHKIRGNSAYMGVDEIDKLYDSMDKGFASLNPSDKMAVAENFVRLAKESVEEIKRVKKDYKLLFLEIKGE